MGIFTDELRDVRGYTAKEGDVYIVTYHSDDRYGFDYIRSLIIEMTEALSETIYPEANISEYITALQSDTFGPDIRRDIYNIFKELSRASGIYIGRELAAIRLAHFGRDMREPVYDALIKLGIEGDLYYNAVSSDFIYSIMGGYAYLDYYIGDIHPYMRLPNVVDDFNNPGYTVEVRALSSTLFDNNDWLKDVVVPLTVDQIM